MTKIIIRVYRSEQNTLKQNFFYPHVISSSPYRTVNTFPLGYKNQPVNTVQANNR